MAALTVSGWLRYRVVRSLLPPDVRKLVEIGVGRGAFGSLIARDFDYVGLEPDAESFRVARSALDGAGRLFNVAAEDYEPEERFDAVCAFEVLEHIKDDVGAVREWSRFARPGGWMILSVPAGAHHFGAHDVHGGHFRRYDRADVERVLTEAGLRDITVVTYGFPIGYAIMAGLRLAARRSKIRDESMETRTLASGRWVQPGKVMGMLTRTVAAPFVLIQKPFAKTSLGSGLVARARVPD